MIDVSVIILTYNEELHLKRCLDNVKLLTDKIFVVDSFSTDSTIEIANELGAMVCQNKWENNHAKQINWALDNLPISTEWILRLDADEYLTLELIQELKTKLPSLKPEVSAVTLPLERIFLGKRIRKGGTGNIRLLRLFKKGKVICEQRWMDEHMEVVSGEIIEFKHKFADHNLNSISWWTSKHNNYAIREAIELLNYEVNLGDKAPNLAGKLSLQASKKRKSKIRYIKLPLFLRAFVYFIYRYFIRFGFLEGKAGFLWHFLQGWWYRTLVDAKIYEIKSKCGLDPVAIKLYLEKNYNIKLN